MKLFMSFSCRAFRIRLSLSVLYNGVEMRWARGEGGRRSRDRYTVEWKGVVPLIRRFFHKNDSLTIFVRDNISIHCQRRKMGRSTLMNVPPAPFLFFYQPYHPIRGYFSDQIQIMQSFISLYILYLSYRFAKYTYSMRPFQALLLYFRLQKTSHDFRQAMAFSVVYIYIFGYFFSRSKSILHATRQ